MGFHKLLSSMKKSISTVAFTLVFTIVLGDSSYANPELSGVTAGNVTVTQTQNTTQVQQTSQQAIIEWNSFNIGAKEKTHFEQPTGGIALNRINPSQGASQIFGELTATGRIIIVNSAGITFGPGATVNVGGIIASTSDISNANFLAGKYIFDQPSATSGAIVNEGHIKAADYGLVALLGNRVENHGLIEAKLGSIALASGNKFTLDFYGDQLINFSIDEGTAPVSADGKPIKNGVENSGTLLANGGSILVSAKAAQGVLDNSINMSGIAQAKSVAQRNGVIILDGSGTVTVSGKLTVSSRHSKGGTISITGHHVHVTGSASIQANGKTGGGNIDVKGKNVIADQGSQFQANAITNGNGGNIKILATDVTEFHGSISAMGGKQSGNGGFVETSGHILSVSNAKVNLLASHGTIGQWLLDPTDIDINDSATSGLDLSSNTYSPTTSGATTSVLNAGDLGTQLNTANITILTTNAAGTGNGDITLNDFSNQLQANWGNTATTLTLLADNNITLNSNLALAGTGKTVILSAGQTNTAGNIAINGTLDGSFALTATSGSAGGITLAGAIGSTTALQNLTLTGPTTISTTTINTTGAQIYNNPVTLAASTTLVGGALTLGDIDLANNALTISTSAITSSVTGTISGTGSINLSGTGTISFLGANSYSGTTTINSGILKISADSGLGTAPGSVTPGQLILSGGTLETTTSFNLDPNRGILLGSGGGTLSVDPSTALTYNGIIDGSNKLTKAGGGTLTLGGGANTYSGGTTITGGTLSIDSDAELGPIPGSATPANINFNGGTLNTTTSFTLDSNRGIALSSNATLSVTPSTTLIYNGIITGSQTFTKDGGGTLILGGINTYTGATIINDGILQASIINAIAQTSSLAITNTANAIFDLNNFDQQIGSLSGGGTTGGNITLGTGNLTISQTAAGTFAGIISGSGGITLASASTNTLTLSGVNTYSGPTTINGGTLSISADANLGTAPGTVTLGQIVLAGGTLNSSASFTLDSNRGISLNAGGGIFSIDPSTILTYNGIIDGPNTLTKTGSGTLVLGGANTYAGITNINAGTLSINADQALGIAPAIATPGYLTLNSGALKTTTDFTLNSNRGISLGTGGGTILTDPSTTLTYNGIINGANTFTKAGNGVLILGGTNTYTGATTISSGILRAAINDIIALSSSVSLANTLGAALDLNNNNETIHNLSGGGTTGGNITLGSGTLNVIQTNAGTFGGIISDTGNLILANTSTSTLTLSGINTYTGTTTLNGGTLSISADSGLGTAPNTATPGQLAFGGGILATTASFTLNSNRGIILNAGGGTISTATSTALTYSGIIDGANALTKIGAGTLALQGASIYTGATNINAGILSINADTALGTAPVSPTAGQLTLSNGTLETTSSFTLDANRGIALNTGGGTFSTDPGTTLNYNGIIAGTNTLSKTGNGMLVLGGTNSYTGATTINNGTLQLSSSNVIVATNTLIIANTANVLFDLNSFNQTIGLLSGGGTTGGNISLGSGTFTIGNSSSSTFAGTINGTGNIVKQGTGTLTLNNAGSSYTGQTTINNGTLSVTKLSTAGTNSSLGAPTGSAATILIGSSSAGTLSYTGGTDTTDRAITVNGAGGAIIQATASGTLTLSGAINNSGNPIKFDTNIGNITATGIISGAGTLTKTSSGTLTLSNTANTYTGQTIINTGVLSVAKLAAAGTNSSLGAANGAAATILLGSATAATLSYTGGTDSTDRPITINGTGGGTIQATNSGTLTFLTGATINNSGNALTFNTSSGNITTQDTISGTGSLTKSGSGILTFGSTVNVGSILANSGTLTINGSSITTSGTQTYNSAVTLGGDTTLASTGNNAISFNNTINGAQSLTVNTTGTTTFGSSVGNTTALTSLTTNAGGITALNGGTVTTTGSQNYGDAVTLSSTTTLSTTNSLVSFASTLNSNNSTPKDLTINTGSGNITLTGSVGATNGLGNLITNSTGITTFSSTVAATSLTTTQTSGSTSLNNNITTTAAQTYNNAVNLTSGIILASTGNSNITLNNTINGAQSLTINTSGTTTLGGMIGNTTALASLTTNAGGITALNGTSITTTGAQNYNDTVTLGSATTLNTTNSLVNFATTVDSNNASPSDLTVNTGSGNITFNNNVGATNSIGNLSTSNTGITTFAGTVNATSVTTSAGGSTSLGGNITTAAAQTFNNAVNLTTGITLLSTGNNSISLNNTVNGAQSLLINTTGNITFGNTVGNSTALTSLTTNASSSTAINGGAITTSGLQSYGSLITLGANTTLTSTANDITTNAISGANHSLSLNNSGTASNIQGIISNLSAFTKSGNGTLTLSNANLYSTTTTVNTGTLNLGNAAGFGTSIVTINSGATVSVSGLSSPIANAITINGSGVGGNGVIQENGTNSTDTFNGVITLGSNSIITANSGNTLAFTGAFNDPTNGTNSLTFQGAGTVNLSGIVGGSNQALGSITSSATTTLGINTTGITTAGSQTYNGAVTLGAGALTTLTTTNTATGDITFGSTLSGPQGLSISAGGGNRTVTFNNIVGSTPLASLNVTGPTTINTTNVTTIGTQTYNNNVTLGSNTLLTSTSGDIIASAINGANHTLAISNTASNSVISGILSNITSLTKSGNGTLTLSAANTYNSSTTISSGILNLTNAAGFGTSAVTINTGAELTVSGVGTPISNTFTINGSGISNSGAIIANGNNSSDTFSGSIILNSASTITANSGNSLTFSGGITDPTNGTNALALQGAGGINLIGAIGASGQALASITSSANTAVVFNAATITTSGAQTYNGITTLAGGASSLNTTNTSTGNIIFGSTINGPQSLSINAAGGNGSVTFDGTVGATTAISSLNITGLTTINTSSVTTVGAQTYNSNITLSANTNLTSNTGNITASAIDGTNHNLIINNAGSAGNITGALSNLTALTSNGSGSLTLANSNNSYTGTTTINNGTLILGADNAVPTGSPLVLNNSTFNLNNFNDSVGAISGNGNILLTNKALTVNDTGTDTFSGIISGVGGSLVMAGSGSLTLSGNNTFTGGTTINAGTLIATTNITALGTGLITINTGGTGEFLNYAPATILNNFTLNGGTLTATGSTVTNPTTFSGAIALTAPNSNISAVNSTDVLNLTGIISGANSGFSKTGNGTLILSNANNSYSGNTIISTGILQVGVTGAIPSDSPVTIEAGATLFKPNDVVNMISSLSGSGNIDLGTQTLIVGSDNSSTTYSGTISGSGSFIKIGTGTLTLANVNSFTGDFTVNGGIINITDANAIENANTIVSAGTALQITNSGFNTPNLLLNGSGLSSAGALIAIGTSSITGNITLQSDSVISTASAASSLTINGTVNGATALLLQGAGSATFNGTVGNTTPLASVTSTTSSTVVSGGSIKTTGDQSYSNLVNITSAATLSSTSGAITIGGAVNGNASLIINSATTTTLDGAIGDITPLSSLQIQASNISLNGGAVTTTGNQIYQNSVTLGANTTLTTTNTGNISFANNINGTGNNLTLVGGSGNSNFALTGNIAVNNLTVTGGASTNSLALKTNNANQSWTITSANSGNITGITEMSGAFSFTNIQNLTGGDHSNTFVLNGGTLSGSIVGGNGTNTLVADNIPNTWTLTGNNAGGINGISGGFTQIQNLTSGNSGSNTFIFNDNSSISGTITGNSSSINTLNYSSYSDPINLTLTTDGVGYTQNSSNATITSFNKIQNVLSNGNGTLTLAGLAKQNQLIITGPKSGSALDPVTFDGFSTFVGSGNNTYVIFNIPAYLLSGNQASVNNYYLNFVNIPLQNYSGSISFYPSGAAANAIISSTEYNNYDSITDGNNLGPYETVLRRDESTSDYVNDNLLSLIAFENELDRKAARERTFDTNCGN
jgi:fibronectin-binding autotransporter adhesin